MFSLINNRFPGRPDYAGPGFDRSPYFKGPALMPPGLSGSPGGSAESFGPGFGQPLPQKGVGSDTPIGIDTMDQFGNPIGTQYGGSNYDPNTGRESRDYRPIRPGDPRYQGGGQGPVPAGFGDFNNQGPGFGQPLQPGDLGPSVPIDQLTPIGTGAYGYTNPNDSRFIYDKTGKPIARNEPFGHPEPPGFVQQPIDFGFGNVMDPNNPADQARLYDRLYNPNYRPRVGTTPATPTPGDFTDTRPPSERNDFFGYMDMRTGQFRPGRDGGGQGPVPAGFGNFNRQPSFGGYNPYMGGLGGLFGGMGGQGFGYNPMMGGFGGFGGFTPMMGGFGGMGGYGGFGGGYGGYGGGFSPFMGGFGGRGGYGGFGGMGGYGGFGMTPHFAVAE